MTFLRLRYSILTLMVFCFYFSTAQKITYSKGFGKHKFYVEGDMRTYDQVLGLMEDDSVAYGLMTKAKTLNTGANVFGAVGGALIGWPLGAALAGNDPSWGLFGIGVGLIAVAAIPMSISSSKREKKAIAIYNENHGYADSSAVLWEFKPYLGGLALNIRF